MRVTAAGPCAGQYYCCYTPAQCAELWETAWRTDLLNALHHLYASGGGMMASVEREAE